MSILAQESPRAVDIVESRLRYGACEVVNWRGFSGGAAREAIWARHRLMGSEVIRIHAWEPGIPDPIKQWPAFVDYVQAVLNAGATPMVTFARSKPPFDSAHNRRWFANRCGEVVWHCIERWGEPLVRRWYWSIWSKPNSPWDNPGMRFEHYRGIYEEVARRIVDAFAGTPRGGKLLVGGPAIDGFQPFWFDWIWRFVEEVDPSLVGFVSWHRYSEWRSRGEWRSAPGAAAFASLVMSRTSEYWEIGRAVQRVVSRRDILNVCGELNAHAHDARVSSAFNQGSFGAAYYAASLLQLIRGGADLELRWSGSDAPGGSFGVMDSEGHPNPVFFAKMLLAHLVPRGSTVRIASGRHLDAASVVAPDGNEALLIVHKQDRKRVVSLETLGLQRPRTCHLLKLDSSAPDRIVTLPKDDEVEFDGYGIAVATARVPAVVQPFVAELTARG